MMKHLLTITLKHLLRTWVEENEYQSRGEFDEDPGNVEEIFEVEGQDEIDYQ